MSTIITTSTTSTTGYKLIVTEADDIVQEHDINATDPANENILKLPENPSNRKWLSVKKVIEAGGTLELSYKASIKLGERTTSRKLEDYMTPEERETIKSIEEAAKIRRDKAIEEARKKPLTEKEKAQKKLDKAISELKSLGMSEEEIQMLLGKGQA